MDRIVNQTNRTFDRSNRPKQQVNWNGVEPSAQEKKDEEAITKWRKNKLDKQSQK